VFNLAAKRNYAGVVTRASRGLSGLSMSALFAAGVRYRR